MSWNTGGGEHFIASNPPIDAGGQVYNVKGSPCKLDGSDDSAAWLAWLQGLPAGSVVVIPGRTTLTIGSTTWQNVAIPANINGIIIDGTVAQHANGLGGHTISIHLCTKITIQGMGQMVGIAGTGLSDSADNAIAGAPAAATNNFVRIFDLDFTGWRSGAAWIVNTKGITLENCEIYSTGRGMKFFGVQNLKVVGNLIRDTQVPNATFTIAIGIDSISSTAYSNTINFTVAFNIVRNYVNSQAILVHDGQKGTILGNVMDNVLTGIALATYASPDIVGRVAINGNTYIGTNTAGASSAGNIGISVQGNGASLICIYVTVVGNVVENANAVLTSDTQGGIVFDYCDDVLIADNVCRRNYGAGIQMGGPNSTRVVIKDNHLTDTQNSTGTINGGIIANAAPGSAFIDGNTIYACTWGMRFFAAAAGVEIGINHFPGMTLANRIVGATNVTIRTIFDGAIYPANLGPIAQTGGAIYFGTGVPSNANGANGDWFFRTDVSIAGARVYHKEAAAWLAMAT